MAIGMAIGSMLCPKGRIKRMEPGRSSLRKIG